MIIRATEIKNNLGKYLKMLDEEDIIITKNGFPIAKIIRHDSWSENGMTVYEEAEAYGFSELEMSYRKFLEMSEKSTQRYEYIDGVAYLMSSPSISHQRVLGNLHVIFRMWFQGKKCIPYFSPFDVTLQRPSKVETRRRSKKSKKADENMNVVQPDLLVIYDHENKDASDHYTGIPAMVVEILSESTRRMDLVRKLDLYMQTGVSEYWIINTSNKEVSVYKFSKGNIADMKTYVSNGKVASFYFEGLEVDFQDLFA